MLNTLVTTIVNLLSSALTGVTVTGALVDTSQISTPTISVHLGQHQSLYQDIARNRRTVVLQLSYFAPTTNLATWETTCRDSVWTILQTLESQASLGSGVTWAAESSTGEFLPEYTEHQQVPTYQLNLVFFISATVRS